MILNMRLKSDGNLSQSLMHYSAHDTTVMPFAATLGNNNLMVPLFGTTYVLELWRDPDTRNLSVRAYAAIPEQVPGNYTVTIEDFPLHCINSTGFAYVAPSYPGSCPLSDLERFVSSSKPQSLAGDCYLSNEDFELIGGGVVGSDQVPDSTSLIASYRRNCPGQACPQGSFLNANLSCGLIAVLTETTESSITHGDAVILGVASVLGGILLGVCATKLFPVFWSGKKPYEKINE
jgi:hypothetical protein